MDDWEELDFYLLIYFTYYWLNNNFAQLNYINKYIVSLIYQAYLLIPVKYLPIVQERFDLVIKASPLSTAKLTEVGLDRAILYAAQIVNNYYKKNMRLD